MITEVLKIRITDNGELYQQVLDKLNAIELERTYDVNETEGKGSFEIDLGNDYLMEVEAEIWGNTDSGKKNLTQCNIIVSGADGVLDWEYSIIEEKGYVDSESFLNRLDNALYHQ